MAELKVNLYPIEVIEQITEKILSDFNVNLENIEVTEIARKFGLSVYGASFDNGTCGFIKNEDGLNKIYVNNTHPSVRQRFTVAHEIGHFILHNELINKNGGTILFRGLGDNWEIEEQADCFAAALLMPRQAVKLVYERLEKNLYATARVFRVSEAAMRRRLVNLGITSGY